MKRNTPRHPKTRALATALDVPRCTAVGILEMLWHATAQLTPRGDIGRLSDEHIAEEVAWHGDPDELIRGLINTRWLDRCKAHRLVIHDWQDHADQSVRRSKAVQEQGFVSPQPLTSDELASDELQASVPLSGNHEPGTGNHEPCKARIVPDEQKSPAGNNRKRPQSRTPFPREFPLTDLAEIQTWAAKHDFTHAQVDHAIETVRLWALSNGKRKASWVQTIQGAMRAGWGLEGLAEESREDRLSRISRELEEEEREHGRRTQVANSQK